MAANTSRLKTFAQATRAKLISLITAKLNYLLSEDNAEIRGWAPQIASLREAIAKKGKREVIEEIAYTWFNRIMALRYMDANGFNSPMVVSIAEGQTRPQILDEGMAGSFDDDLNLKDDDKLLTAPALYRKLLVASCNRLNEPMPFLFEHITDYIEMLLPDDLLSAQSFVTDIRNGMTDEDCQDVEVVGWLYQFYINDRKDEAEKNKSRRGGLKSDEQAAATQLFTPHWIVRYMVENSLGRIWMTLHPDSKLVEEMPYYLAPVDGQKDQIPEDIRSVADIRFLDPCMGSGHILVYAFDLLTKMYEEEGFPTKQIPGLIFENNLYGMDIDPRCYQLASFALTMKARAYYSRFLRRPVQPKVIALQPIDRQTIESTGNWPKNSLVWQMENLDTIGSLLKITPEEASAIKVDTGVWGEQTRLMKKQADYLSRSYHCVVTNPPYLGKGFGEALKNYIGKEYPNSKADTMATFMERCMDFCEKNGKMAMINQDSWMFTVSYRAFRHNILETFFHIDSLIHLGPHAFAEINGEKVKTTTFIMGKHECESDGIFINVFDIRNHLEKERKAIEIINNPLSRRCYHVNQKNFRVIEGEPISFWGTQAIYETFSRNRPLSAVASPCVGLQTADNGRFLRSWFEVDFNNIGLGLPSSSASVASGRKFFPYNKGGSPRRWYGNQELIINWENDGTELRNFKGAVIRNPSFYFKECISWGLISGPLFRYFPQGFIYDVQGMSCFYNSRDQLYREIAWQNTKVFREVSKIISPAGHIQIGEIADMPCCDNVPKGIEKIGEHNIQISKQDWDSHETSWDFQESPLLIAKRDCNGNASDLDMLDEDEQKEIMEEIPDVYNSELISNCVKVYKNKWAKLFQQLHHNEEELNRKFIEIYGLQDELTPYVPLDEVTILQKGEISIEDGKMVWHEDVIIKQFISYLVGCFMGRYSVDRPGLMIANQGQKPSDLDLPHSTIEIDDDGIIPIIQEADFFADDMTVRVEEAVGILFSEESKKENLKYIRDAIGMSMRDYFFKEYYKDHLAMYSVKGAKRPIYWLFSSKMGEKKKKGYFKALVYMHRMEGDTLSKLHADYVHPYIGKLEREFSDIEKDLEREDLPTKRRNELLKLSETLRGKIREVKEFESELVKMASARPTFDLDDGVATNYPKFYPLVEPIKGLDAKEE
ncbi:MAG: BREX-1 system adenine-specific DNA-methyltransferase PglX [Muribaculaceae bacterium]|nr:BREX-1 system adenine-specific DNA-methyltransferase PglX [Muribaculaceae bacterium]